MCSSEWGGNSRFHALWFREYHRKEIKWNLSVGLVKSRPRDLVFWFPGWGHYYALSTHVDGRRNTTGWSLTLLLTVLRSSREGAPAKRTVPKGASLYAPVSRPPASWEQCGHAQAFLPSLSPHNSTHLKGKPYLAHGPEHPQRIPEAQSLEEWWVWAVIEWHLQANTSLSHEVPVSSSESWRDRGDPISLDLRSRHQPVQNLPLCSRLVAEDPEACSSSSSSPAPFNSIPLCKEPDQHTETAPTPPARSPSPHGCVPAAPVSQLSRFCPPSLSSRPLLAAPSTAAQGALITLFAPLHHLVESTTILPSYFHWLVITLPPSPESKLEEGAGLSALLPAAGGPVSGREQELRKRLRSEWTHSTLPPATAMWQCHLSESVKLCKP